MTRTDRPPSGTEVRPVGMRLTKFRDPLRIPPVLHPGPSQQLTIRMRAVHARLHSELPPTWVWAYDEQFPGPTIEVHRGQRLRVAWDNELTGSYPVTAVEVPNGVPGATPGPGREGAEPLPTVAALPPWTVVHLHGSRTGGGNDGWPENAVLPGNAQLSEYPNDQRATALWYHDHAMAITALNVMTGLAGMYLIRDAEESELRLPHGDHEVPLIIADRNLDTDVGGNLTGRLLHKVGILSTQPEKVTLPFLGPFTLVNGVIWPHFDVEARWYRFRLLNASNSRFYTLALHDEKGVTVAGALRQIGTDGGLLPAPLALDEITLAPAERADVLVDFSAFQGRSLTLANTLSPPLDPGTGTPNPDLLQFRVSTRSVHEDFRLPAKLSTSFVRLTHDTVPEHMHRWLVLTLPAGRHPEMWEMVEIDQPPAKSPTDGIVQVTMSSGAVKTLQRVSRDFKDAPNFYVDYNGWEQWSILNASPVTHPIHIHLIQFQALSRDAYDITGFDPAKGGTSTPLVPKGSLPVDPNEQGWKDVIRVGGGQLVRVAGQFGGANGRYVYHCHILEHEDEGMMRTFVVMPKQVMAIDPHITDGHHPLHPA
ncbi:MAG TPA: multicopper oxidase domain-containing protein [Pseudonocardiaceae bacterium]|nr:multicopper oxidase domain-containing protein [Pseudonocardiaceae bacterium]